MELLGEEQGVGVEGGPGGVQQGSQSVGGWGFGCLCSYSGTVAWKSPWTEEPGGLQSVGSLRVRLD